RRLLLHVHPFIAAYLKKGIFPLFRRWNFKYHICLKVMAIPSFNMLEYRFLDRYENEIDLS
ncbi:MAG TPA: ribonuclease E/G, partial [Bacteroidales bacterium]|nr:ribonuclease E/G [Bacteroidales bacterium]